MKITVINGTEKHGVTYRLKEMFLEPLKKQAEITEYNLPKDCPQFCKGCFKCVLKGEHACPDYIYIQKIAASLLEADLIVLTSPAYVFHTTGAMKSLLDHFAYLWMSHHPAAEFFTKRAVILTQCLGVGAKSTAKDIKHSLSWWGISAITVFTGTLMNDIIWEKISDNRRLKLTKSINKLSQKFSKINYAIPAHTNIQTKIKFLLCRRIRKSVYQNHPDDYEGAYWAAQGWLGQNRPWRA